MNPETLDSQLSQFEAQLALLSEALVGQDVAALVGEATRVQSMAVCLSKLVPSCLAGSGHNPLMVRRVQQLQARLASTLEGLLRQRVQVDRALAALVPASQNSTYLPQTGAYGRQTYASAGRQSGEFRALTA